MLITYLNYPNSSITLHGGSECGHIRSHKKDKQRIIKITIASLSEELYRFLGREHSFASNSEVNDMWLEIDCSDQEFDIAIIKFLQHTLGQWYIPIKNAKTYRCECLTNLIS